MPGFIRYIARYANGGVALLCIPLVLVGFSKSIGTSVVFALVAALAAFNVYVIERAARLLSEEEWLKGEIRKEMLRQQLAGIRQDQPLAQVMLPPPQPERDVG
jgi:hypothetical protein